MRRSAAAVGTYESDDAVQHKLGYSMLKLSSQLFTLVNVSTHFVNIAIMAGLATYYSYGNPFLLKIGIGLFALSTIFSFITLPVAFDTSYRGLNWLKNKNIINTQEYNGIKRCSLMGCHGLYSSDAGFTSSIDLFYFLA